MVIHYSRSNGVDDSVMNIHLDNFVQSLPVEIRSNLTLTKHERGTTYNPQLVLNADLVIVGLRDDEDAVVGRGVHDECMHALETGKYVLVVRQEDNDDGQIFLQEIREQDLDILDDGAKWEKYASISLFDYATRSRMPTAVDQHDLDNDILLNFMLGNNEETKEYMRLRFPDFVAPLPVAGSIVDTSGLLSSLAAPAGELDYTKEDPLYVCYPPFGGNTASTPGDGYKYNDQIIVTLPMYPGMTFNFQVGRDWLCPMSDTHLDKFFRGIGITMISIDDAGTLKPFINQLLGRVDYWSMTHLWEDYNYGEATQVINALERRIKFAGGTFTRTITRPESKPTEPVAQSAADKFFDLVDKQPQVHSSSFISGIDPISKSDNDDELLLLL